MKRISFLWLLTVIAMAAHAQIARWTVHPEYDAIKSIDNGLYQVKKAQKVGLMGREDTEILPLQYDSIADFREGYALIFNKERNEVVGFTDLQGHFTDLESNHFKVKNDYPYFSCGYVMVSRGSDYFFVNTKGEVSQPYAYAQPYFYRKASVCIYKDLIKRSDTFWAFLDADNGQETSITGINNDEINFISSVSKGKALVVHKKKFYEYSTKSGALKLLCLDPANEKKSAVTALGAQITTSRNDTGYTVMAKNAQYKFDEFMRLRSSRYPKQAEEFYEIDQYVAPTYTSELSVYNESGNRFQGLFFDGSMLLPPQFQTVSDLREDEAIVKLRGKYGVVMLERDQDFQFSLNNNEDIGFLHDKFTAKLVMTMPAHIKSELASVESKSEDCQVMTVTRDHVDNVEISALKYDCVLSIPEEITDVVQEIPYYFAVNYDGLKSVEYEVMVNEWYIKNYVVERTKTSSSGSTINVDFTIKEDQPTTSGNYFRNVTVEVGDDAYVSPTPEKITENNYSAQITGVSSSKVPFIVKIKEGNCPVIDYTFELDGKGKTQSATAAVSSGEIKQTAAKPVVRTRTTTAVRTQRKTTTTRTRTSGKPATVQPTRPSVQSIFK